MLQFTVGTLTVWTNAWDADFTLGKTPLSPSTQMRIAHLWADPPRGESRFSSRSVKGPNALMFVVMYSSKT